MRNFIIYLCLALVFLTIESTLLYSLIPSFLIPDVILIMVFHHGFRNPTIEGALITFALGYVSDVFSGGVIGLSSFALVCIFTITCGFAKIVTLNSQLIKIGGTIFMGMMKGIIIYISLSFLNQAISFNAIFPAAISTGIVSPFIIALLEKIECYFIPYKRENTIIKR